MATIEIRQNQFEDSVTFTSEDGHVLEVAVTHLPGSDTATFNVGTYDSTQNIEETYRELLSCPVNAA